MATITTETPKPESESVPRETDSELPSGLVQDIADLATETYFQHSPKDHREAFHKNMGSVLTEASAVVDKPKIVVAALWQHGLSLKETADNEFELTLPKPRSALGEDPIRNMDGPDAAIQTLIGQGIKTLEAEAKGEHKDARGSFDNFYSEMIDQHLRALQTGPNVGSTAVNGAATAA